MQHISFPAQRSRPSGNHIYRVPFLTENKYEFETGSFLDFPRLHNHSLSEHPGESGIAGWLPGKYDYLDNRMFVQEWAFFRLIQEAHSLLALPFDRKDWIEDDNIRAHGTNSSSALTTEHLHPLALIWAQVKLEFSQDDLESRLIILTEYTHEAMRLSVHCYNHSESNLTKSIGLKHTICAEFLSYFLSAIVVCEYIQSAIIGLDFQSRWYCLQAEVSYPSAVNSSFLHQQLESAGWCPIEIATAWSYRSVSIMLTLSCFDRRGLQRQHRPSSISDGACECEIVDRMKLKAVHVSACDGCDGLISKSQWASIDSAVVKAVTNGAFPVLNVNVVEGRQKVITLDVVQTYIGSRPTVYVAFSHLWMDGLGPPSTGHIPACQILRLVDLAKKCTKRLQPHQTDAGSKSDRLAFPFWLDSICVPQSDIALADKARQEMAKIYSAAAGVIVIDSTWQNVSFDDESAAIVMAHIVFSRWMTRGWTFQEAAHACCCFYLLQDRLVTRDEIDMMNRGQSLVWGAKKWPDSVSDEKKVQLLSLMGNGNPCSYHSKKALDACTEWKRRTEHASASIGGLWRHLHRRIVSHRSDEALIISGLMRSSVRLDNVNGEDRMRKLFQSFQEIPESMLFHLGERYLTTGTKWIPRSIFRGTSAVQGREWRWNSTEMSEITPAGLIVSAAGVLFKAPEQFTLHEGGVIISFGKNRYWLSQATKDIIFNRMKLSQAFQYGLIYPPASILQFRADQISSTVVLVSIAAEDGNRIVADFDGVWHCNKMSDDIDLSNWLIVDAQLKSGDQFWCVR